MSDLFEKEFQTNAYLVSKDAKGKVRCVRLWYEWNDSAHAYLIKRQSWQLNGKRLDHPDIPIKKGLVSRTLREQTQLQFNSKLKEYKDKGYKEVEEDPDNKDEKIILNFLPEYNTDSYNHIKPMLAKQEKKVIKREIFDNEWLASRKINGLRCCFYWDGKHIKTYSRGGENYDLSTQHLTKHPILIEIFKKFPTLVLDSELYKHGKSLQQISGAARLERNAVDCDWLEIYCYDCFFTNKMGVPAKQRELFLIKLFKSYNIYGFNPIREWQQGELQIQLVPQVKVSGWENIEKLHNKYVSEGFEGVVLRDPDKPYKPNSRGNQMIKVKHYLDATYKVIDYELGLRGSEDMTFILQMPNGQTFKASPMGDRATKADYVENFDKKYKNHLGDCKYFEISDSGIPCQPKFTVFRFDLE